MTSPRKAKTRESILDAAYAMVARMGVRRTTFEDVAAKAGLSRQTLYRYFDGKDDLIGAVMEREADRFFEALGRVAPEDVSFDEALQQGLSFTFDYLRTHPLLSWVYEHEPNALLPHLRSHWGPILDSVRRFVEPFVAQDVADGVISGERADMAGDWVTRVVLSYLIMPGEHVDIYDDASVRTEIPDLILRGLRG